jgi:hypothetical protein
MLSFERHGFLIKMFKFYLYILYFVKEYNDEASALLAVDAVRVRRVCETL